MFDLHKLPSITNEALGGLVADDAMKHRIFQAAADQQRRSPKRFWSVAAPVLSFALILTLAFTAMQPATPAVDPVLEGISYQTAGHGRDQTSGDNAPMADALLASTSFSEQEGLWIGGQNDPPMLLIGGRAYRMMNQTADMSLLGSSEGQVAEFTTEPALTSTRDAVSNVAPAGSVIRPVKGMGSMLKAVEFDGAAHLFQRVSYNGSALIGSDTLADTLALDGHVTDMTLDGVGTVRDGEALRQLVATLIDSASQESSDSLRNPDGYLTITLDNGLMVQLAVGSDRFSACGTWNNPDFFEQFAKAAQ